MTTRETEVNEIDESKIEAGVEGLKYRTTIPPQLEDPFADLSKLRVSQEFAESIGAKKLITRVLVKKPDAQWWVRVHPSPKYRLDTAILAYENKTEFYLVARNLWTEIAHEIKHMVLFTAITRQGEPFIWPVQLPGPDGRHHDAHRTNLTAAQHAMNEWTRVTWDTENRKHDVMHSGPTQDEPQWPDISFQELLKIGFKDRFITSMDHIVLKKLRGEEK